jgi:putative endonuclease
MNVVENMNRKPTVYIVSNKPNGTIYTGVTSDLLKRIYEHKQGVISGFTQKYGCKFLAYYEQCESMVSAIEREKQIKGGSRNKKIVLIENMNPAWLDLYETLI